MTPRAVGFLGTGVVAEIEDVDLENILKIYVPATKECFNFLFMPD